CSARDREVLVPYLCEHRTPTEIAAALGRPAVTVRVQIHRALARLRSLLPVGLAGAAVLAALPQLRAAAAAGACDDVVGKSTWAARTALGRLAAALLLASLATFVWWLLGNVRTPGPAGAPERVVAGASASQALDARGRDVVENAGGVARAANELEPRA